MSSAPKRPRRWLALLARIVRLLAAQRERSPDLVRRSYDSAATGYDDAWTSHMRDHTLALLEAVAPAAGADCIDLMCGTGFVTAELARRSGRPAVGVDASAGMLAVARSSRPGCELVHGDALGYLRSRPAGSADVIVSAWGLGYSRPLAIVREASRVLRPGGRLGVIDNSLFSLAEVLWTSILTFAEYPEALRHVLRVRFLPSAGWLATWLRSAGFRVLRSWSGSHAYHVRTGAAAIERLRATGAAAGFELACAEADRDAVWGRFAELFEARAAAGGIPIVHRYIAAVGVRR